MRRTPVPFRALPLAALLGMALTACGGGGSTDPVSGGGALGAPGVAPDASPSYVRVEVDLAEPSDAATDPTAEPPVPEPAATAAVADLSPANIDTETWPVVHASEEAGQQRMSNDEFEQRLAEARANAASQPPALAPAAANLSVFTPAQIRSAYEMTALPARYTGLTSAQAAALGAGQTIYIVDAYHAPTALSDLNAFSAKFGLPTCVATTVTASTALPLPAAATAASTCPFVQVTASTTGTVVNTAPAYDAGWAAEIALDVQWAHAIAPLARIVLIEAPSSAMNAMLGGVKLANRMGAGVVSMSWAGAEGSYVTLSDYSTPFTGANMSYLAATGDWGAQNNYPAVMQQVLAVGGTRLGYAGSGTKTETAWTGTGGGVSAYVAMPGHQAPFALGAQSVMVGKVSLKRRAQADVAFNADPYSGQYVAITTLKTGAVGWYAYGGTSIATPQWAGLVALANAQRALSGKAPLGGRVPSALYSLGSTAARYNQAFLDITAGSNGNCAYCKAGTRYDVTTGLGVPRVGGLLTLLAAY